MNCRKRPCACAPGSQASAPPSAPSASGGGFRELQLVSPTGRAGIEQEATWKAVKAVPRASKREGIKARTRVRSPAPPPNSPVFRAAKCSWEQKPRRSYPLAPPAGIGPDVKAQCAIQGGLHVLPRCFPPVEQPERNVPDA